MSPHLKISQYTLLGLHFPADVFYLQSIVHRDVKNAATQHLNHYNVEATDFGIFPPNRSKS